MRVTLVCTKLPADWHLFWLDSPSPVRDDGSGVGTCGSFSGSPVGLKLKSD